MYGKIPRRPGQSSVIFHIARAHGGRRVELELNDIKPL